AKVDDFLFFQTTLAVILIVVPPDARPVHELLLGSFRVAVMTPVPPVFVLGVQPARLAFAFAVCARGVALIPGVIVTLPFSDVHFCCGGVAAPAGAITRPLVASAAAARNSDPRANVRFILFSPFK